MISMYESMRRIVQYASDYLDIVPDTSANDADVTQVRQMLDAYAALALDWDNAPDDAKWYTIDANGAATWSEEEPFFSSAGKFPETFWDVNGDYHVVREPANLPLGIDWRLCKWSREVTK